MLNCKLLPSDAKVNNCRGLSESLSSVAQRVDSSLPPPISHRQIDIFQHVSSLAYLYALHLSPRALCSREIEMFLD